MQSGRKRNELIAAEKQGHKVLLFGKKVFRGWTDQVPIHENADIEVIFFPEEYEKLGRLSDFTLVILDYEAFYVDGKMYKSEQEVFEKQMLQALEMGTNFCFIHYDQEVPVYDEYAYETEYMDEKEIKKLRTRQLGFRWLNKFSIKPYHSDELLLSGKHSRSEFKTFLDRWGASHNAFEAYKKGEIDDPFYTVKHISIGFTLDVRNGRLIYIPFQRDISREDDVIEGINCLIDSCLTYITNNITEIPEWAKEALFDDEKIISEEIDDLESRIEEAFSRIKPYHETKAILFQSQYMLERTVPSFIERRLNISVFRDEKYLEDFWLLNENKNKIAICEIKSIVKGFKKSAIFSLYNHRESHKLDEQFPGLLIANTHMQAGSWADKDRPIDVQDYQTAAQNNILILRVLDLVRLWRIRENGDISDNEILNIFKDCGWLNINQNLELELKK